MNRGSRVRADRQRRLRPVVCSTHQSYKSSVLQSTVTVDWSSLQSRPPVSSSSRVLQWRAPVACSSRVLQSTVTVDWSLSCPSSKPSPVYTSQAHVALTFMPPVASSSRVLQSTVTVDASSSRVLQSKVTVDWSLSCPSRKPSPVHTSQAHVALTFMPLRWR